MTLCYHVTTIDIFILISLCFAVMAFGGYVLKKLGDKIRPKW